MGQADGKKLDFKTADFRTLVLEVIAQIPEGQVMTYGQVARVAGKPRNPRQVGDILQGLHLETDHPWWRVINSSGRLSTYKVGTGDLQKRLLEAEGIVINASGKISLERYRWQVESPDEFARNAETMAEVGSFEGAAAEWDKLQKSPPAK